MTADYDAPELRQELSNAIIHALLNLRTDKGPYSGDAAVEVTDAVLYVLRGTCVIPPEVTD